MVYIEKDLSNEEYHRGESYSKYVSSSQLKNYLKSPKHFRYSVDNSPKESTDAMRFGSLFHSLMENIEIRDKSAETSIHKWRDGQAVFTAPINEKTGKAYGVATNVYKTALEAFTAANIGKNIVSEEEVASVENMARSMFEECGATSNRLKMLIRNSRERETSYFYESDNNDGVCLKIRPDMLTNSRVVDWKTTSLSDLSEGNIAKAIIDYGYHISLSMYQYILHKATNKWYTPLLVFVQKQAPYDCVVCDISEWCYNYDKGLDDVCLGVGALEFTRLLNLHRDCLKSGKWQGVEMFIPKEGKAIMKPSVPAWYERMIPNY